jgi:hypothetical protein
MKQATRKLQGMVDDGEALLEEKRQNRRLLDQLRQTTEQLEQARASRGLIIPERKHGGPTPKVFARLICGDLHGSHADKEAVSAMLTDLKDLDVREVVLLGDMLECGGWMMQSHTLGYVAQLDEVVYEDDVANTNDFLDWIHKLCPKAAVHYIEGNHELRMERWCVDAAQGNKRNAEYLLRAVGPQHVLFLEKRGIRYYRQSETYGCETPGTFKLGKSYFTHSTECGKNAANAMVERFAGCVFFGNTHRAAVATTRLVNVGLVSAWNPGCLCNLQPRWHHGSPTTWSHGYILQLVNAEDDTFQAIPVPIYKGKSYLTTLLKTVR